MIWNVTHFLTLLCKDLHVIHYRFDAFLAPISIGIITGKHYTKNYSPKLNGRSDNRNRESVEIGNYNKTEEPSESWTRKEIIWIQPS